MMSPTVARLVSGGQTGVDRAALDFAVAHGMPYGGWVPRGGRTEDGVDLLRMYPHLKEMPTAAYPARTRQNVTDSDATLIICPDRLRDSSRGTRLTARIARDIARPLLIVDPDDPDGCEATLHGWLMAVSDTRSTYPGSGMVLNVAGPRASGWPEGYAVTYALLRAVLVD